MAYIRHLNPMIYLQINSLWKNEIGQHNLFKLKYTLTHFLVHLEDFLNQCQAQYLKLVVDQNNFTEKKQLYIEEMSLALENYVTLAFDKDVNSAFGNKKTKRAHQGIEDIDEAHEEDMEKAKANFKKTGRITITPGNQ